MVRLLNYSNQQRKKSHNAWISKADNITIRSFPKCNIDHYKRLQKWSRFEASMKFPKCNNDHYQKNAKIIEVGRSAVQQKLKKMRMTTWGWFVRTNRRNLCGQIQEATAGLGLLYAVRSVERRSGLLYAAELLCVARSERHIPAWGCSVWLDRETAASREKEEWTTDGMGIRVSVLVRCIYTCHSLIGLGLHTWAKLNRTCTWLTGYILPTGSRIWVAYTRTRTRSTRWVEVFAY
jgi:hypothetical protein